MQNPEHERRSAGGRSCIGARGEATSSEFQLMTYPCYVGVVGYRSAVLLFSCATHEIIIRYMRNITCFYLPPTTVSFLSMCHPRNSPRNSPGPASATPRSLGGSSRDEAGASVSGARIRD